MGGIDGLETASRLRDRGGRALVVFVTVEAERFRRAMDRLGRKLPARKQESGPLVVLFPGMEVPAGVVLYATITDHYLKVYTAGGMLSPDLSMVESKWENGIFYAAVMLDP